jgi:hypothetical protein
MPELKLKIPTSMPKITRKAAIALAILALAAGIGGYFYYLNVSNPPITTWNYRGQLVAFRVNLREAATVPVYPSDDLIYRDLMNPFVKNVTIAFKDAGTADNPYYILEEMEIIPKTTLAYAHMLGSDSGNETSSATDTPVFNAEAIENYANLPGKIQNPIIALVHYKYANETSVRMEGHVTYISGKTPQDFDKATVRFLMIVMGISPGDLS